MQETPILSPELAARAKHWLAWLEPALPWLTAAGVALAVISLLAIPALVIIMPRDYFVAPKRPETLRGPLLWALRGLRNAFALVLVMAGLAMLVLPGQGLLTLLLGIMASTFPGKYRLERWLVRQPGVFSGINWMRRRAGRPPLYYPAPGAARADNGEDMRP